MGLIIPGQTKPGDASRLIGPDETPLRDYLKNLPSSRKEKLTAALKEAKAKSHVDYVGLSHSITSMVREGRIDDVLDAFDDSHVFSSVAAQQCRDFDYRLSQKLDSFYRRMPGGREVSGQVRVDMSTQRANEHRKKLIRLMSTGKEKDRREAYEYFMDNIYESERKYWSRDKFDSIITVRQEEEPFLALGVKGEIPSGEKSDGVTMPFGLSGLSAPLVMYLEGLPGSEGILRHEGDHVKTHLVMGKSTGEMSIEELLVDEMCAQLSGGGNPETTKGEGIRSPTELKKIMMLYYLSWLRIKSAKAIELGMDPEAVLKLNARGYNGELFRRQLVNDLTKHDSEPKRLGFFANIENGCESACQRLRVAENQDEELVKIKNQLRHNPSFRSFIGEPIQGDGLPEIMNLM